MATVTIEEKLLNKQNSRNMIRAKLVEMGLAESSAKLDTLATIINGIVNNGAVSVQIREGETYTIPKGYHDGSGTVSGVAGGGSYKLEPTKTVTPTKQQQNVTPASGFYGLEGVTVGAIPEIYQDVSSVTVTADDVLATKVFVDKAGTIIAGTMTNNGAVSQILDATIITYTIPKGYHSGEGKVSISLESKTVTPTKSQQKVTPSTGKVLGEVIIGAIPDEYQDVQNVDAVAADVLSGKTIVDSTGAEIHGEMPNNGAKTATLDAGGTYTIPEGYHNGLGKITAKDLASQTEGTADSTTILSGETAWVNGVKVTGEMPNNGVTNGSLDGINTTSVSVPAGYTSGGTVNFDSTAIEELLDAI